MISKEAGLFLLSLARKTIEAKLNNESKPFPRNYPKELNKRAGIFVTLYKKQTYGKSLRGCIGLPYPSLSLIEGCIEASISVMNDPRFPPLELSELNNIIIEISILSSPVEIRIKRPEEYLSKIKIGKDGLIIKKGTASGLLLPQVPLEQKWTIREYLYNICLKAGLNPEDWMDSHSILYKFHTNIFSEE